MNWFKNAQERYLAYQDMFTQVFKSQAPQYGLVFDENDIGMFNRNFLRLLIYDNDKKRVFQIDIFIGNKRGMRSVVKELTQRGEIFITERKYYGNEYKISNDALQIISDTIKSKYRE